jgi:hypothetical protein
MIGKLSELLVSGHRAGLLDVARTSPRSPLDLKMQSPRGLKKYDLGGVGLGIVAALEKSSDGGREVLAKYAVCSCSLNRSNPIPVNSGKNCGRLNGFLEDFEGGSSENYTYVTCRGPSKSFTRVYYDGGEYGRTGHERHGLDGCKNMGILLQDSRPRYQENFSADPTPDFLSSCHLCRKELQGKDIYMYRYNLFSFSLSPSTFFFFSFLNLQRELEVCAWILRLRRVIIHVYLILQRERIL